MSTFEDVWGVNQRGGGGPAFPTTIKPHPQQVGAPPIAHPGLSIREYYAAHAPAVPDWFAYRTEEEPPGVPSVHGLNEAHKRQVERILANELAPEAADPVVQSFWSKFSQAKANKNEWRDQMRAKKFFRWRWHYADMMIEAGSAKP